MRADTSGNGLRRWFNKKRALVAAVLAAALALSGCSADQIDDIEESADEAASQTEEDDNTESEEPEPEETETESEEPEPEETETESEEPEESEESEDDGSQLTSEAEQAVRAAESYLEFQAFSKEGLIRQLSSDAGDGYPEDVAREAVNSLDVDYNEQAVRSAESYLEFQSFSCDGMIDQLSSDAGDQFTTEQAEYAAAEVGLC